MADHGGGHGGGGHGGGKKSDGHGGGKKSGGHGGGKKSGDHGSDRGAKKSGRHGGGGEGGVGGIGGLIALILVVGVLIGGGIQAGGAAVSSIKSWWQQASVNSDAGFRDRASRVNHRGAIVLTPDSPRFTISTLTESWSARITVSRGFAATVGCSGDHLCDIELFDGQVLCTQDLKPWQPIPGQSFRLRKSVKDQELGVVTAVVSAFKDPRRN